MNYTHIDDIAESITQTDLINKRTAFQKFNGIIRLWVWFD
jgi:hypothetical protein